MREEKGRRGCRRNKDKGRARVSSRVGLGQARGGPDWAGHGLVNF